MEEITKIKIILLVFVLCAFRSYIDFLDEFIHPEIKLEYHNDTLAVYAKGGLNILIFVLCVYLITNKLASTKIIIIGGFLISSIFVNDIIFHDSAVEHSKEGSAYYFYKVNHLGKIFDTLLFAISIFIIYYLF